MRFGIGEFTGGSDGLREGSPRDDFVAEVTEGSREGAFDAEDAIACTDEGLEGVDHREACADGGFVAIGAVVGACGLEKFLSFGPRDGEGFFVGGDDVDSASKGFFVEQLHFGSGGTINKYRNRQTAQAIECSKQVRGIVRRTDGLGEIVDLAGGGQAFGVKGDLAAVGKSNETQVDVVLFA